MDLEKNADATEEIKAAIFEKILFRKQLAQKISITRLDYILRVLRSHFKKATISDPDAFKDRIKAMERQERVDNLRRIKSTSSFRSSVFNRSAKTGLTDKTQTDDGETMLGDDDEADQFTSTSRGGGIANDPVMINLNEIFELMQEQIDSRAQDHLSLLTKMKKVGITSKPAAGATGLKEDPLDNDDRRDVNKGDFNF